MIRIRLLIAFSLMLLTGCLGQPSSPSRYYVLEEVAPVAEPLKNSIPIRGAFLQVGPIMLPRYLDRPQIVSREEGRLLTLGEFDRWSEPLHESFTRVIAGNLGKLLSTSNILIYPNRGPADDDFYQLRMEVSRFDGRLGGELVLEARWTIVGKQNRKVMPLVREFYLETVAEPGYQAYVLALNNLLTRMSRQIAERIAVEIAED